MSTRLEEELAAGMREHTADLRPSLDLLDRATRAHWRRQTRVAAGAGLGLVAVLAVTAYAIDSSRSAAPSGDLPVAAATGTPSLKPTPSAATTPLTAAEVLRRARAALDRDGIEHVVTRKEQPNGAVLRSESWHDPVTGDQRGHTLQPLPGQGSKNSWIILSGGGFSVTDVFSATRTYAVASGPDPAQVPVTGTEGYIPEELRALLASADGYEFSGHPEVVQGRRLLMLRKMAGDSITHLWFDADTYLPVRRTLQKQADRSSLIVLWQFDWLLRSAHSLTVFKVTIPPGYTEVPYTPPVS
ncbi:hypothetical protein [Catellatospora tritici]|uniref:hypothetical protein n=1 Tax=Catellatospora tritici TaxID=2851566 RepID=UPI001C2DD6B7|nr:hypothetical protein [Catellatospora tritici]MBV1851772.1 hypothetical protein [Catellatospora tritici]